MRNAVVRVIQWLELRQPLDALQPQSPHSPRERGRRVPSRVTVTAPARVTAKSSSTTSLTAPRKTVTLTGGAPDQRYSFYTPELSLMAETELTSNATPVIAYEYIWFGGQPLAQIETATSTIAWYFNDHLGTPILQTDAAADVVWRVEREPYGKTFSHRAGPTRHQPLAFPGQEETGDTSYNIFRWYRSGWGRYTQADPIGLEGGANLYTYANNNPHAFVDPGGLSSIAVGRAVGGEIIEGIILAGIVAGAWAQGISQADVDAKIQERTQKKCQCSEEKKKQLHDEKNRQCNARRQCNSQMDLTSLQARRAQNARCAFARQMINVVCFDGGDMKHLDLMNEALGKVRACDDVIERLMKKTYRRLK